MLILEDEYKEVNNELNIKAITEPIASLDVIPRIVSQKKREKEKSELCTPLLLKDSFSNCKFVLSSYTLYILW